MSAIRGRRLARDCDEEEKSTCSDVSPQAATPSTTLKLGDHESIMLNIVDYRYIWVSIFISS